MNLAAVSQIAKAVLYEGYMLYPYRPSSVKNRRRWNFGVLCPRSYSEDQGGTEAWMMRTECLLEGTALTTVEVRVRFLQLVERSIGQLNTSFEPTDGAIPDFHSVPTIEVAGRIYQPWQEAVEREVILPLCHVEALAQAPLLQPFCHSAEEQSEYLRDEAGLAVGVIIRQKSELNGVVEVTSENLHNGFFKITVSIRNVTPFTIAENVNREDALLSSLVSTHTVLGVENGRFCSLSSSPDHLCADAARCQNLGTWPVLVGVDGDFNTMLSSPIILPDYPQIAPESTGDLFDGTEIDEILMLRIMTLTDDEKREMRQSDEHARRMLERTEALPEEQFMKLHGVLRNLRPLEGDFR